MSRIKALVIAYGDISSASARIRTWNRLFSVDDMVETTVYSGNEDPEEYDVVYVQKRVNKITFDLVDKAKRVGTPVVFDIDDAIGMSAAEELNVHMMQQSDRVIVDTEAKRENFLQFTRTPIFVIPDGVDYFTTKPENETRKVIKSVCTFGWDHNLKAACAYMEYLTDYFYTSYVGYKPITEFMRVPFVKWEIATFIKVLRTFDCVMLAHGDEPQDRLRCCNRVLTSIMAGVLPIVKDTSEYKSLMLELDAKHLLVNSPEMALMTIKCLSKHVVDILPNLQKIVWEKYQPRVGGVKLVKVFVEAISA